MKIQFADCECMENTYPFMREFSILPSQIKIIWMEISFSSVAFRRGKSPLRRVTRDEKESVRGVYVRWCKKLFSAFETSSLYVRLCFRLLSAHAPGLMMRLEQTCLRTERKRKTLINQPSSSSVLIYPHQHYSGITLSPSPHTQKSFVGPKVVNVETSRGGYVFVEERKALSQKYDRKNIENSLYSKMMPCAVDVFIILWM